MTTAMQTEAAPPAYTPNSLVVPSSTIRSRASSLSSRRTTLLQTLAQTDYAPPAFDQQQSFIKDLAAQVTDATKNIEKLESSRVKEYKDHEKYRDSIMKRYAYIATGRREKFQARAAKEEREYFEALENEHRARETLRELQSALREAEEAQAALVAPREQHLAAHKELLELLDSVFAGQSEGFPEEDAAEVRAGLANVAHENAVKATQLEKQTIVMLRKAFKHAAATRAELDSAEQYSRVDVLGGGAAWDMFEHDHVQKAQIASHQLRRELAAVQSLNAKVGALPVPQVHDSSLLGDVLFDNIISDLRAHDRIKAGKAGANQSCHAITQAIELAKTRSSELEGAAKEAKAELESAREALYVTRTQAFDRALQGAA